jgi:hypothetical protein
LEIWRRVQEVRKKITSFKDLGIAQPTGVLTASQSLAVDNAPSICNITNKVLVKSDFLSAAAKTLR